MSYSNINDDSSLYQPTQPYQPASGGQPAPQPQPQQQQQTAPGGGTKMPDRTPHRSGLRTGAIIALVVALLLVFGVGLFAGWQFKSSTMAAPAPEATLQPGASPQVTVPPVSGNNNIEAVRVAVIAKVRPAVVQVNVATARGGGIGSGVIIDKRGYIVTNNHVVEGAQRMQVVLYDGAKLDAQLVGTDAADDLAVIKINPPAKMVVATLGDSSKLQVGQDVLAVGNPLGITQTVTNGIISALGRRVDESGGTVIPNAIQTDAPINPGNSGGALVDLKGNLIGIPTLAAVDPEFNTPANGVGFAIPVNRVSFIVPQIIQNGAVTHSGRAGLGVSVAAVDPTVAAQDNLAVDFGALIVNVTNGQSAAQAGLRPGDVIVQIDNQQVTDTTVLADILASKNPGDKVAVKIYRGNQQMTVNVTLGELQVKS
ncbi:S1C family serine protease [Ktedonosporobacter rubrisoli]|nr:trypsin-like peptidase domain-containing protein [Ktedonosporobacter rubrisoli]